MPEQALYINIFFAQGKLFVRQISVYSNWAAYKTTGLKIIDEGVPVTALSASWQKWRTNLHMISHLLEDGSLKFIYWASMTKTS